MINLLTWLLIDLVPIGTIFFLHWRNYRKESQKQTALAAEESSFFEESSLSQFEIKHNWDMNSAEDDGQYSTVMLTLAE